MVGHISCFPILYPKGILHLLPAVGLLGGVGEDIPIGQLPIVSVDTETTGTEPATARVVEYAIKGPDVDTGRLVNPGVEIPAEATAVHGISTEQVRSADYFAIEPLPRVIPLAYNAQFDRAVIEAECERNWVPFPFSSCDWIDPLVWAREIYPKKQSRALGEMCKEFGIQQVEAHRAGHDAAVALEVWNHLSAHEAVPKTYKALIMKQRYLIKKQSSERRWR